MKRQSGVLAAVVVLSALSGCLETTNPITGGTTTGTGTTDAGTTPAILAGNLAAVVYDGGTGTLQVQLTGLDSPDLVATMTRAAALDIDPGDGTTIYQAYTVQETTMSRQYLAYFAEGSHVMAGAVATEGEYSSFFGGTAYDRSADFVQPTAGSARYIGAYAGVLNLTPNNTTDRGSRITGDAFVRVNFAESLIEGGISNRSVLDTVDGTGQLTPALATALSDVSLRVTELDAGAFLGDTFIGAQDVGTYGGVLGGPDAEELAAVLVFTPVNDPTVMEYGALVLARCGTANDSPSCP